MRIYQHIDVELTYQNHGSSWLCILRGSTENIDSVFNAVFNFGATNGEYEFQDHSKTVATFWTDETRLHRFFYNLFFFRDLDGRGAELYANTQIATLRATSHEFFKEYDTQASVHYHSLGKVRAERPDLDFKDSVVQNAFAPKDEQDDEKTAKYDGEWTGGKVTDAELPDETTIKICNA